MEDEPIRIVPFDGLWKMAVDVPYSMLAGRGQSAWSCGQLAMDSAAKVVAPNDLVEQSEVVCDVISEILRRGQMEISSVRRLVLYYVNSGVRDVEAMLAKFGQCFGPDVVLDTVAIPVFYYDGILLEVDVFCGDALESTRRIGFDGGSAQISLSQTEALVSLEVKAAKLPGALERLGRDLAELDVSTENTLNEHWFAPSQDLDAVVAMACQLGQGSDASAILDGGPDIDLVSMRATIVRGSDVVGATRDIGDVRMIARHAGDDAWLQARSLDLAVGLVGQTEAVMRAFEAELVRLGFDFADVVKQTAHYVGGTAAELHDNMAVRNGYYSKPGPASTGIPVYGYVDSSTRTVVDLRLRKNWR